MDDQLLAHLRRRVCEAQASEGVGTVGGKELVQAWGRRSPATVLISACLVGHKVSWRAAAAKSRPPLTLLRRVVELHPTLFRVAPVCPEIVFGSPRPPIRMVGHRVQTKQGDDVTERLLDSCHSLLRVSGGTLCVSLDGGAWVPIDGFVLKRRSPSCALIDGRIYSDGANTDTFTEASGVFARHILRAGNETSEWTLRGAPPMTDERFSARPIAASTVSDSVANFCGAVLMRKVERDRVQ